MLEARRLVLRRGERELVRDLSFTLDAGRALHVQGGNGAGKTTLLRTVCGLRPGSGGELLWRGEPLPGARARMHTELLYLGHRDALHDELDAGENLRVAATLAGEPAAAAAVSRALDAAGLGPAARRLPARSLSQGQRRRAALARLFLTRRRLWVLDEPLAALDAGAREAFAALLTRHLHHGGLALLACHETPCWNSDSIRPLALTPP